MLLTDIMANRWGGRKADWGHALRVPSPFISILCSVECYFTRDFTADREFLNSLLKLDLSLIICVRDCACRP